MRISRKPIPLQIKINKKPVENVEDFLHIHVDLVWPLPTSAGYTY
jgi:hypothetical protein